MFHLKSKSGNIRSVHTECVTISNSMSHTSFFFIVFQCNRSNVKFRKRTLAHSLCAHMCACGISLFCAIILFICFYFRLLWCTIKKTPNEIETMIHIHTIMISAQVNDCLIISWSLLFPHYAIRIVQKHIQRILPKYVNVGWIWHTIHLGICTVLLLLSVMIILLLGLHSILLMLSTTKIDSSHETRFIRHWFHCLLDAMMNNFRLTTHFRTPKWTVEYHRKWNTEKQMKFLISTAILCVITICFHQQINVCAEKIKI